MFLKELVTNANHKTAQSVKESVGASKSTILADADTLAPNPMVSAMELVPLLRQASRNKAYHHYLYKEFLPSLRQRYGQQHSVDAYKSAVKMLGESSEIDTVTLDVPLLIRLLEYAREDAQTDMDLHHVAEKLIALGQQHRTLSMKDYQSIVKKHKENN